MVLPSDIKTKPAPDLEVPEVFSRLRDIVYNLWWSWSPQAHLLFNRLSPATWQHYRNPIDVLIDLGPERWEQLQDDPDFSRAYHDVVRRFTDYVERREPTWFEQHHGDYDGGPFAYFSTEYGWHECLQIYSGGLGVLSGDHCKSASDLGIPLVGVGLMYRHGYFRQTIDAEGMQQHFYPDYDVRRLPLLQVLDPQGKELHIPLELPDRQLYVRVWRAMIGRVPVLLLDSDLPINHSADRAITSTLYVRGREMRLCQEIVLGIGGVKVLEALGIQPSTWHMNEGHSALLSLERIRRAVQRDGISFDEALKRIRVRTIFTTHTPVTAGNETFDIDLVRKYFAGWAQHNEFDLEKILAMGKNGGDGKFNLTALALRTCARSNGVSELHGKVAKEMWKHATEAEKIHPIEHVTNGVHVPTWIGPEIGELLLEQLETDFCEDLTEEQFALAVEAVPDHRLWSAHQRQKRRLLGLVRERLMEQFARHGRSPDRLRQLEELFDPETLLIGFARRFATYKRADLLLRDMGRLQSIVNHADRPVQFLFAGMAHPADRPGQDLIRNIWQASQSPELLGRLVFLESYDMRIARHLVQGVDVWMNTPRRPLEASGTSGMKAAINGVLNFSIRDGWWCEGYDPQFGWAIGPEEGNPDEGAQDHEDAESLYHVLGEEVAGTYYRRNENGLPADWIRFMKGSIGRLGVRFSTARMLREYTERYYLRAARRELQALEVAVPTE